MLGSGAVQTRCSSYKHTPNVFISRALLLDNSKFFCITRGLSLGIILKKAWRFVKKVEGLK